MKLILVAVGVLLAACAKENHEPVCATRPGTSMVKFDDGTYRNSTVAVCTDEDNGRVCTYATDVNNPQITTVYCRGG